jgi:hypothetical protein
MVDGDLNLDAMITDQENSLHFRRLNNPIAVLRGVINRGIEYVSVVLSGNAPVAKLIRLMISASARPREAVDGRIFRREPG